MNRSMNSSKIVLDWFVLDRFRIVLVRYRPLKKKCPKIKIKNLKQIKFWIKFAYFFIVGLLFCQWSNGEYWSRTNDRKKAIKKQLKTDCIFYQFD